jgi:hypothetical protein
VARYVQFSTIFLTTFYFRHLDLLPLSRVLFERARLHCDSCALVIHLTYTTHYKITHFTLKTSSASGGFAPGPHWGHSPQTSVIGSRSALAMGPGPPRFFGLDPRLGKGGREWKREGRNDRRLNVGKGRTGRKGKEREEKERGGKERDLSHL